MNVAGVELRGSKLRMNPSIDVNETTGIVLAAKRAAVAAAWCFGVGQSEKFHAANRAARFRKFCASKNSARTFSSR